MATFSIGHRGRGNGTDPATIPALKRGIVLSELRGKTWFVDSNATGSANGSSWTDAYTTLQAAIDAAAADDTIYIAPAHAESIGSAGAITVDKAGLSIVGIGNRNRKPTFTWSAVAGTFLISAANVLVANIRCTASAAATKLFSVTAAGVTLDAVDYVEGSAVPLQFLLTTNAADQLTIRNCYHRAATAGASTQIWIQLVGTEDTVIEDNVFQLVLENGATCAAINATTAVVNAIIRRNTILQTGGTTQVSAILLASNSTGFVHDNRVAAAVTTLAGIIALASAYGAENYALNTANKSGILDPVADS